MRRIGSLVVVLAALAAVGCEEDDGDISPESFSAALVEGAEPHEQFQATSLSGAEEVPAVTTEATGDATFTLVDSSLTFELNVADIDSATAAHIHIGAEGENGGILVPLFTGPTTGMGFTGTLSEGAVEVADSVAAHMRAGNTYVNVHTTANPPGEIRDQVELVSSGATGEASFAVTGSTLDFDLTVDGLDEVTAAHIHLGAEGVAGPVLVPLFTGPMTGLDFSGLLAEDQVTVADSVIEHMRAGNTYVNVHTVANPMGAIRGQIGQP